MCRLSLVQARTCHCEELFTVMCPSWNRLLGEAFDEWADATVEAAAAKAAAQAAQVRRQLLAAQAEAARLAADNARYARLIDNPDWGWNQDNPAWLGFPPYADFHPHIYST